MKIEDLQKQLVSKSCVKQDVFGITKEVFGQLNEVVEEITKDLEIHVTPCDSRVELNFKSSGEYESRMTLTGDAVIFHMHTNVFSFPPSHRIFKSPYVQKDDLNAYCGVINIYNFLADSFRFHRLNDSGYLIGRIFVNRDKHFFVEGQNQLGFLFNDFSTLELNKEKLRQVVLTALNYIINFDLYTPPYPQVNQVKLHEIQELSHNLKLQTGKRLGFQFEADQKPMSDF
ncbi:MAG: hypothetical protein HN542_09090 [Flavobacteriales bacterium]|nr:hypothetical protein [Flavobacteriales bacterium]MBT3963855.1 hypothetical protein [Flavobacteriales bacterium]MBT4704937.1 hypothetical protein [Flavobacteriales bacterium]MBT4929712.1 hypothetical protein [Flavobacteriales bacterium]MBT5132846.1 hypothetical protein [Flavobacteriales bacterium]